MNFYCHFCDRRCHLSCPDLHEWWCKNCAVTFREGSSTENGLDAIFFLETNPDGSYFNLTIDFKLKTTWLSKTRAPKGDDQDPQAYDELPKSKRVAYLHYPMQNVNPDNLQDKIKTLLVFS